MRENRVRSIWREGGAVLNGWLAIPSSYSAEVMAHQGWDSLTVDLQHGAVDYQAAVAMFQAISTTGTVPLARVPWNEAGIIMKLLDAGSYGIICPMVNSRAECEAFVGACRYPPGGFRSHGPNRAVLYGGADYPAQANETVITMAMIETAQAVKHVEDIVSVPGLDSIYVGPADLSLSFGLRPQADSEEPRVLEAYKAILSATRKNNVAAGLHTNSPRYALRMVEMGFQFVTIGSDARMLNLAGEMIMADMKRQTKPATVGQGPY